MSPSHAAHDPYRMRALRTALNRAQSELQEAQAELTERMAEIYRFEAEVDARLGGFLDQLADLEEQVRELTGKIERLKEERLFGAHYTFDQRQAPRREQASRKPPPSPSPAGITPPDLGAELRALYRQLARRYHPDLAWNEADRAQRTEKMAEINTAYADGNLAVLKALAIGAKIPTPPPAPPSPRGRELSPVEALEKELEDCQLQLRQTRDRLEGLHRHPSVTLSLNVKLARREGHDLLGEMARELRRKITRKTAERDYLLAQLDQMAGDRA